MSLPLSPVTAHPPRAVPGGDLATARRRVYLWRPATPEWNYRWPGLGRRSAPGPRRSTRAVLPAGRHRCDQRIDYVFFRSAMRISWSTLTLLFSREMRLTACFRPAIVRWWLISVGMIADTTRRAADDDAYTLVENLAGMGTLVSAPSTLRYLELTYERSSWRLNRVGAGGCRRAWAMTVRHVVHAR